MEDVVRYVRRGSVGTITIDSPPVNALSKSVQSGFKIALKLGFEDELARALLILCKGSTFIAGADIRDIDSLIGDPGLTQALRYMELGQKPIIAAIHGTALGGGLEVALACHYRVALLSAKVGLPEVKLGLLPGAGGTQRLPRITGAKVALDMISTGKFITAQEALRLGVIDEVVDSDDIEVVGLKFAQKIVKEGCPPRRVSDITKNIDADKDSDVFANARARLKRLAPNFVAPFNCVAAVEAAFISNTFDEGLERERELFDETLSSDQRNGMIHLFFAEREVSKIPGLRKDIPIRDIKKVGVVGAGIGGGGSQ